MATQENLIFRQIQEDSRDALNHLFDIYFDPLCHFANSFLMDHMLAEEIVLDVFFNLWAKRKSLKISGEIKPYLYKATRNQAISYLRRPSFQFEALREDITKKAAQNPEQLLIEQEETKKWQSLIDNLPERCRLIFTLHRTDGFSYQEIADLLEIAPKTVENQMGKALRILKESLSHISHRALLLIFVNITLIIQ